MTAKLHEELPVKVTSKDDVTLTVSRKVTTYSGCLTRMLDVCQTNADAEFIGPIVLEVEAATLEKVLNWCENYEKLSTNGAQGDSASNANSEDNKKLQDFNSKFINALNQAQLFELLRATDYLEIIPLMDVATKKIATMIVNKKPAEIRQFFQIENDFSHEEALEMERLDSLLE